MVIKFPKVNWEKVGAYTLGGLLGGGLSALAWHMMEKRGINPGLIFKKKVIQGNVTYYDPEKDPNVKDLLEDVEEMDISDEEDDGDGINEDYVDEDPEEATEEAQAPKISQIEPETWYRSEEDEDYKHAQIKYWIDDQQCSDENNKLIPKPWLLIGGDNYDALSDEDAPTEMFIRNEELETDFLVTRVEGSFD